MDDLFVPDNSWLMCDKGTIPARLKVTHHNNTSLYGEFLASEADMIFGENIPPLGVCSVTRKPCSMQPIYWDKTTENIKVNGYKLLIKDACLLCTQGGKISIGFSIIEFSKSLTRYDGQHNGVLGAGLGAERSFPKVLNLLNKPGYKGVTLLRITDLHYSQSSVSSTFSNGSNLGTLVDDLRSNRLSIPSTIDSPPTVVRMSNGNLTTLDHRRIVAAQKAGSKVVGVYLVDGREPIPLDNAERFVLDKKGAKRLSLSEGEMPKTWRAAAEFRAAKQGRNFPLSGNKEIPQIKGNIETNFSPSKAQKLISQVSESIQSQKSIIKANQFLIDNVDKVAKVGKVAGRAAIVVGIAADAISIYGAYQEDGGKVGTNTKQAVGSAAGGLAGAKIGAAIGAIGGPVGVIVGGVVGGIIGGLIGSGAGKWLGSLF
jgi:hypothetical protein